MDRELALESFRSYVSAYDPENPRIALKIDHTLRVAELCDRIASSLDLLQEDIDLAWMLGLLHDIGRFEQVRRFDTFNDAISVGHAALGVEVLLDAADGHAPLIREFLPDEGHDDLVRVVVGTHSAYRLPDALDERTRMFCNILRDADKVDILKVNCICPIEDIYSVSEREMAESDLSPECIEAFYEHHCLPRRIRRYPADTLLGHVCFAWEIVFEESLRIVREQGHLREMLGRTWVKPATGESFAAMAAHLYDELDLLH